MDMKQREIWNMISIVLFAVIIAIGMIVAANVFSNSIAGRPVIASISGSLSQNDYGTRELMDIDELRVYLSMHPTDQYTEYYDDNGKSVSSYGLNEEKIRDGLQRNITSGTWLDFPYVQLGERLYFSKQAVDEWFYTQGKAQLNVK